jgi:hypothetical protein
MQSIERRPLTPKGSRAIGRISIALTYRICVTLSGMTRKLPDTCAYGHIIDGSYCAPGKKPRRYCKKCAVRRVEEMRERRKAANTKVSNK